MEMEVEQHIRYLRLKPLACTPHEPAQWYAAATVADGSTLAAAGKSQAEALARLTALLETRFGYTRRRQVWVSTGSAAAGGARLTSLPSGGIHVAPIL